VFDRSFKRIFYELPSTRDFASHDHGFWTEANDQI
jgi:hypothetical protein